jgi:hypothetical protein
MEEIEGIDTALESARSLSLLQEAEQRRGAREHSLFLDVPTWNGDLIAEYRVVPPEKLQKIAQSAVRQARNNGAEVEPGLTDMLLIVTACVGLYMRDPDTGERVPIEDEFGHVRYDRIAGLLGKDDIESNREAVKYLMSEREPDGSYTHNIVAISVHADKISRWMRDPSKRGVDLEELLGES